MLVNPHVLAAGAACGAALCSASVETGTFTVPVLYRPSVIMWTVRCGAACVTALATTPARPSATVAAAIVTILCLRIMEPLSFWARRRKPRARRGLREGPPRNRHTGTDGGTHSAAASAGRGRRRACARLAQPGGAAQAGLGLPGMGA